MLDELAIDDFGILKPEWQRDAACAGMPAKVFFPERGQSTREARQLCARCEVRTQCLDYALETTGPDFGIWAGTSWRDRVEIRRRRDRAAEAS